MKGDAYMKVKSEGEIVLTKEQADLIERIIFVGEQTFALRVCADQNDNFIGDYQALNELKVEELARALYVGYTVEKTQEERKADVKEYFKALAHGCDRYAVKDTLDFLGIKIEGVNA